MHGTHISRMHCPFTLSRISFACITRTRVRAHACLLGYFSIGHFRYGHTVIFPIAVRIIESNTSNCAVECTQFCTSCVADMIIVLILYRILTFTTNNTNILQQIRRYISTIMLKPQSHRTYDQVTTYLRSKNVGIVGQS